MATVEMFWNIGHKITKHNLEGSISLGYRKFRAFFGTSPIVCMTVWDMLLIHRPHKSKPEHLLWALLLLKRYHIGEINAALVGVSEKTFNKWTRIFIHLLSDLPVVNKYFFSCTTFTTSLNFLLFCSYSLIGKTVSKTHQEAQLYLFLLMEPTSEYWNHQTSIRNGFLTSSMARAYATK